MLTGRDAPLDVAVTERARAAAEVAEGGYYRAGLRCANLLLADERLRSVPVILYTILERSDLERDNKALPSNSSYVGKSSDVEVLLRKVRSLIC